MANTAKLKIPQIIGHRGTAGYAPENTLVGIHTAADMDVRWVELDVKITKDFVPVIFHDDMLERTTNGTGPVAEMTYEELKHLETGSWFSDSFAGEKIPTLEEALEVIIDRDLGLNLEIKPCPGRDKETTEAALDVLSTVWDDHDNLLISSFSHMALSTALDMAEDWHRGLLLESEWPDNWAELADYLKVSTVNINGNTCEEAHVNSILSTGLPVLAYTINDPTRARILQSWGVSGFFSDLPDVVDDGILSVH